VPLGQAVIQWKSLFNGGILHVPAGRKNKAEFTNVSLVAFQISSDPGFQTVYSRIKAITESTKDAVRSGKRKRGGEPVKDEGPSKKRITGIEV
jgi:hypothetical protein